MEGEMVWPCFFLSLKVVPKIKQLYWLIIILNGEAQQIQLT